MMKRIVLFGLLFAGGVAGAVERWDALYEPQVFEEMLVRVMKPINFDAGKKYPVIVSLHGAGGHGTYILTQLDPNYFAAAAPAAGSGLKTTEEFIDPAKIKDLPIWAFHGDKEPDFMTWLFKQTRK